MRRFVSVAVLGVLFLGLAGCSFTNAEHNRDMRKRWAQGFRDLHYMADHYFLEPK